MCQQKQACSEANRDKLQAELLGKLSAELDNFFAKVMISHRAKLGFMSGVKVTSLSIILVI